MAGVRVGQYQGLSPSFRGQPSSSGSPPLQAQPDPKAELGVAAPGLKSLSIKLRVIQH